MKSKVSILIIVALFLLGFTMIPLPIVSAESEIWYITEDTTLTADHVGRIWITVDDITLDGAGYHITGASGDHIKEGILLWGVKGVTVKNCYLTNFFTGIVLQNSDGNTISNNVAYDNYGEGFSMFEGSDGNVMEDNIAENNGLRALPPDVGGDGFDIEDSSNNILRRNIATGNKVNGFNLRGIIEDCHNNVFIENIAKDNLGESGFYNEGADGTTFIRNKAFSHQFGFDIGGNPASDITLQGNIAIGNDVGFRLADLHDSSVEGNKAIRNVDYGFYVMYDAEYNLFSKNVGFRNGVVDAYQSSSCRHNTWELNHFGSTDGIE